MAVDSARATAPIAVELTPGPVTPTTRSGTPWQGRSIMIRHLPGGMVCATSQGLVAVAGNEGEALRELARLVRERREQAKVCEDPSSAH